MIGEKILRTAFSTVAAVVSAVATSLKVRDNGFTKKALTPQEIALVKSIFGENGGQPQVPDIHEMTHAKRGLPSGNSGLSAQIIEDYARRFLISPGTRGGNPAENAALQQKVEDLFPAAREQRLALETQRNSPQQNSPRMG